MVKVLQLYTKTFQQSSDIQTSPAPREIEEPDRQHPIHKKPHPLKKCKLFRNKTLEDHKAYLRDNYIYYRFCGSTQHMAKDCKMTVKCLECNSDKHIAALHPGPPPMTMQNTAADKDDSREQSENPPSSVTSKCTEVCGNTDGSRSCSKVCLVKAYPEGKKEKAIKMYAVLDEQSNKFLANTEFFSLFEIKVSSYTLKTCSGRLETSGKRATDFIIKSMDRKLKLPLPRLIVTWCLMIEQRFPPQRLRTITPTYGQLLARFHLGPRCPNPPALRKGPHQGAQGT